MANCWGGPSQQEESAAAQQQSLASSMAADYQQHFAQQEGVLTSLNNQLTPMAENPQGFTPQQQAALNTTAIDSTGAANANTLRAEQGATAGRGGSSGLESGVQQQIRAGINSNAANALAGEQLGITQANAQQQQANQKFALNGLNALSGDYSPTAFGSEAQSGFGSSFNEANTINQQEIAKEQAPIKLITSLAGDVLGGISGGLGNLDTTGSSTGGEQAGNFFSGFAGGL